MAITRQLCKVNSGWGDTEELDGLANRESLIATRESNREIARRNGVIQRFGMIRDSGFAIHD